jgi:two-component system, cell cycle sensor histidine kinase and response regulator CckA
MESRLFGRDRSIFSRITDYKAARQRGPISPVRVLIVDDEEPVRTFVQRVIAHGRYETMVAADGPEAIEVAASNGPFDLLLTDLIMPKMNGDELARRLRQTQPSLKVLYLTGFSERLFKERLTLLDSEAFLDKPCTVKSLLQAVALLVFGQFVDAPPGTTRR